MRVEFHPAAKDEIWAAVDWYEQQVPDLGWELLDEVQEATKLLAIHPEAGQQFRSGRTVVRRWNLERFPYALFYRPQSRVLVVALAHTRRTPGYWLNRLQ